MFVPFLYEFSVHLQYIFCCMNSWRTVLSRSDGKCPNGVSVLPWASGKPLIWDATCPDTYAPSYRSLASLLPETLKEEEYSNLMHFHIFVPIAIESLGVFGPRAMCFIREDVPSDQWGKSNSPPCTATLHGNPAWQCCVNQRYLYLLPAQALKFKLVFFCKSPPFYLILSCFSIFTWKKKPTFFFFIGATILFSCHPYKGSHYRSSSICIMAK